MTIVDDFIASEIAKLEKRIPTPDPVGYGVDVVCADDLDPHLREIDPASFEGLAQDAYHRVSTARGQLPDDPDYGIDLVSYLNTPHTDRDLRAIEGQVAAELRKDDRFAEIDVTVTSEQSGKALTVSMRIVPADAQLSTFTLIVAVTDGATLLKEIRGS